MTSQNLEIYSPANTKPVQTRFPFSGYEDGTWERPIRAGKPNAAASMQTMKVAKGLLNAGHISHGEFDLMRVTALEITTGYRYPALRQRVAHHYGLSEYLM